MNRNLKFMTKCFPHEYKEDLEKIVKFLSFDKLNFHDITGEVEMSFGKMTLPSRIYYDELSEEQIDKLNFTQKRLVYCYYLAHHDGYVRQKYLRILFSTNYLMEYEIPYIFMLIGSYVIEIVEDIYERFDLLVDFGLDEFIRMNQKLTMTTEGRLASYWGEYYQSYNKSTYIGFKIQKYLKKTRSKYSALS